MNNATSMQFAPGLPNKLERRIEAERTRLNRVYEYLLHKGMTENDAHAYLWRFSVGIPMTNPGYKQEEEIARSWMEKYVYHKSSESPVERIIRAIEYTKAEDKMSNFDKMVEKLKSKGHSEESAKRIAAFIGRKKYGAAGMAAKAAAGRKG